MLLWVREWLALLVRWGDYELVGDGHSEDWTGVRKGLEAAPARPMGLRWRDVAKQLRRHTIGLELSILTVLSAPFRRGDIL